MHEGIFNRQKTAGFPSISEPISKTSHTHTLDHNVQSLALCDSTVDLIELKTGKIHNTSANRRFQIDNSIASSAYKQPVQS